MAAKTHVTSDDDVRQQRRRQRCDERKKNKPDVRLSSGNNTLGMLLIMLVVFTTMIAAVEGYACRTFSDDDEAEIVPRSDIYGEVGQEVSVYCNFNTSLVDKNEVAFKKIVDGKFVTIESTLVNDSTIVANLVHTDDARYNIHCFGPEGNMCSRIIYIGHPPGDIENLRCRAPNWERLDCTFNKQANVIPATYSFIYVVPSYKPPMTIVPTYYGLEGNLSWDIGNKQLIEGRQDIGYRQELHLLVTSKNSLGTNHFNHSIDVYESVVPNKVTHFTVESVTSDSVFVKWMVSSRMEAFPGNVVQELGWTTELHQHWFTTQNNMSLHDVPHDSQGTYLNKTIVVPHPYMTYTIRHRMHTGSGAIHDDMWSEPAYITATTEPRVPEHAVATDVSSFEVVKARDFREVYVYWSQLPREYHYGPEFQYSVKAFFADTMMPANTMVRHSNKAFVKFPELSKDRDYVFHITAQNKLGAAVKHSEVSLPRSVALPLTPERFTVIKYKNPMDETLPVYRLIWNQPKQLGSSGANVTSYTIYWCEKPQYSTRCDHDLHWDTVSGEELSASRLHEGQFTHKGFEFPALYERNISSLPHNQQFGIAAVTSDGLSSGLLWASCSVHVDDNPPAPKPPTVTNLTSRSVKVEWELSCPDRAAVPLAVNVTYCEVLHAHELNCITPLKHAVSPLASPLILSDLRPSSTNVFYLSILSVVGSSVNSNGELQLMSEDVPTGAPVNLSVTAVGNTTVALSWSPPDPALSNGVIVRYSVTTDPPTDVFNFAPNDITDTVVLPGLQPFTSYDVLVSACTAVGCSNVMHSASRSFTTQPGVPEKLERFNFNSAAGSLSWSYDLQEGCHSSLCTFDLSVTYNGTTVDRTNLTQFSISLEDLGIVCIAEESLNISIRAVGRSNDGHSLLPGPLLSVDTPCTVPGLSPLSWGIIAAVATLFCFSTVLGFILFTTGKNCRDKCAKKINVPGLVNQSLTDNEKKANGKPIHHHQPYSSPSKLNFYHPSNKKTPLLRPASHSSDIDPLEDESERHARNPSGDSSHSGGGSSALSSEADSALQSAGEPQDSSSAGSGDSRRMFPSTPQSRDLFSGRDPPTRSPGPYVTHGRHQDGPGPYVTARSIPNFMAPAFNAQINCGQNQALIGANNQNLQRSTPNLPVIPGSGSQPNLMNMRTPATSAGYFSTTDSDAPVDDISKSKSGLNCNGVTNSYSPYCTAMSPLPHYSRHSFTPPSKAMTPQQGLRHGEIPDGVAPSTGEVTYVAIANDADSYSRLSSPDSCSVKFRPPSMPSIRGTVTDTSTSPYCFASHDRKLNIKPAPSSHNYVSASSVMPLNDATANNRNNKSAAMSGHSSNLSSANSLQRNVTGSYVPHNNQRPSTADQQSFELRNTGTVESGRPDLNSRGYVTLGDRNLSSRDSTRNGSATLSNPSITEGSTSFINRNGYVTDDSMRWAERIPLPQSPDEAKEVRGVSAPGEISRDRYPDHTSPGYISAFDDRPKTSDGTSNGSAKKTGPCLSKSSSGYASQEAMSEQIIMFPHSLIPQSNDQKSMKGTVV